MHCTHRHCLSKTSALLQAEVQIWYANVVNVFSKLAVDIISMSRWGNLYILGTAGLM